MKPDNPRARAKPNGRTVSELLADFGRSWKGERIALGDIVDALANRGHGLLLLLFALPNCVPIYLPGLSAVFGLPMAVIAAQMILGHERPWLPQALLDRSLARADYETLIGRTTPYLAKIERVLKPRLLVLADPIAQRAVGLLCLCLALLLSLPIPFTNIPLALPVALLGLGLIARDGLLVLIGAVAGVVAATGALVFGWTALGAAWKFLAGLVA